MFLQLELINFCFQFFFQEGDYVLVELKLEEGRNAGSLVCYVAQVKAILEDGKLKLSFLRMKSTFTKDTFFFPVILDEESVEPGQCKGVLVTSKGGTKRQADLVKVLPPLTAFNMHL